PAHAAESHSTLADAAWWITLASGVRVDPARTVWTRTDADVMITLQKEDAARGAHVRQLVAATRGEGVPSAMACKPGSPADLGFATHLSCTVCVPLIARSVVGGGGVSPPHQRIATVHWSCEPQPRCMSGGAGRGMRNPTCDDCGDCTAPCARDFIGLYACSQHGSSRVWPSPAQNATDHFCLEFTDGALNGSCTLRLPNDATDDVRTYEVRYIHHTGVATAIRALAVSEGEDGACATSALQVVASRAVEQPFAMAEHPPETCTSSCVSDSRPVIRAPQTSAARSNAVVSAPQADSAAPAAACVQNAEDEEFMASDAPNSMPRSAESEQHGTASGMPLRSTPRTLTPATCADTASEAVGSAPAVAPGQATNPTAAAATTHAATTSAAALGIDETTGLPIPKEGTRQPAPYLLECQPAISVYSLLLPIPSPFIVAPSTTAPASASTGAAVWLPPGWRPGLYINSKTGSGVPCTVTVEFEVPVLLHGPTTYTLRQLAKLPRQRLRATVTLDERIDESKVSMQVSGSTVYVRLPLFYAGAKRHNSRVTPVLPSEIQGLQRGVASLACMFCKQALLKPSFGPPPHKVLVLPHQHWLEWADLWLCHEDESNLYVREGQCAAVRGACCINDVALHMHPADVRLDAMYAVRASAYAGEKAEAATPDAVDGGALVEQVEMQEERLVSLRCSRCDVPLGTVTRVPRASGDAHMMLSMAQRVQTALAELAESDTAPSRLKSSDHVVPIFFKDRVLVSDPGARSPRPTPLASDAMGCSVLHRYSHYSRIATTMYSYFMAHKQFNFRLVSLDNAARGTVFI
ncbi:hypothetical protein EON66_04760, partial [archaeon]